MVHRARTASSPTDRKYAASGFLPKATNGRDHPRHLFTSIVQWQMARTCAARPAVNKAYELVHRFLLMGSARAHSSPTPVVAAPAAHSHHARSAPPRSFSQSPAKTPQSAVAIAGTVLNSPSGSQDG